MKYSVKFIIFTFSLIPFFSPIQGQQLVDKVIARVGSEYISLSDVEEEYQYAKVNDKTITDEARCALLQSIIAQKVLIYQAKLDSVEVSDDEVEAQLDLRFSSILRQMNGDEEFFKEYYGASIKEMKERYRDDQKQKILAERMQYKLISEVDITPDEVLEYFNQIPQDSLPFLSSEVVISELVVEPQVNEIERAKALAEAEEVYAKIKEGQDFATLAKAYSDDTESAKRGGDLGFATRGTYVPDFEAAVFGMEANEISDIIETEFGFHIIKQIERRGNRVKASHILISPLKTIIDEIRAKELLDSIRTLIIADSITFEEAVKKHSIKEMPSYSNSGKLKNPATGTNFFETKDLDYDTYFAIENLQVGEISKIVEMKNFRGGKMYRILKLQSKSKPHRANLKEDYDKITLYAKESKKNQYFAEWLEAKMGETFIQVDPLFFSCPALQQYVKGVRP